VERGKGNKGGIYVEKKGQEGRNILKGKKEGTK
jgi:hypothetical protein